MEYINGKKLQKKLLLELKKTVSLLDIKPQLAVISLGNDKINQIFFKQIKTMCEFVGYDIKYYYYEDISLETLLTLIKKLNNNSKITSILIEEPILNHLPKNIIRNAIHPKKDIEGMTDINRIKVQNQEGGFLPGTVLGIIKLLDGYHINIQEKNITIIGRSSQIGKPLANYFLNQNSTVTICHSKTKNLKAYLEQADIVITATGKANILSPKDFKQDSVVIDVGVEYLNGKLQEDIDFSNTEECMAKYIVKSIGGVGPMTIAAIAENILTSYYLNHQR